MVEKTLSQKLGEIIRSPRFLQLFLVGVVTGLNVYHQTQDVIYGITSAIGVWLTGSVAVGTVDRNSDKKLEVANKMIVVETIKSEAAADTASATVQVAKIQRSPNEVSHGE